MRQYNGGIEVHTMNKTFEAALPKLLAALSVAIIIASGVWIYHYQFATRVYNQKLHVAVGEILADETVRLLSRNATVVVVTMRPNDAPEIGVQLKAFERKLKAISAITIKDEIVLDPGDNPKFRPGAGLSAKRLLKIARKHKDVDAIISFVGAPELTDDEISELKSFPKFIAETHSPEKLGKMFEKKILQLAIVPRFEFPAPGPQNPETDQQWFDRYFQIIRTGTSLSDTTAAP